MSWVCLSLVCLMLSYNILVAAFAWVVVYLHTADIDINWSPSRDVCPLFKASARRRLRCRQEGSSSAASASQPEVVTETRKIVPHHSLYWLST